MARARTSCIACFGLLALWLACSFGCDAKPAAPVAAPVPRTKLQIMAAASLAQAFREVGRAFESANPDVAVDFAFAGSNQLRTQLENGAPGDVFASADRKQIDAATASSVVDPATVRVFAQNRLALIVPKENRAEVTALADLARPNLKIIVADQAVPAGNYTRLMLEKAATSPDLGPAFVKAVEANIVSREENVAAVVAKIALNEADAGFAYASDAFGGNSAKLTVIALPSNLEMRADYMAAVTARTSNAALAGRFVAFLVTKEATAILARFGFAAPDARSP